MIDVLIEFAGNLWIALLLALVVLGALPVRSERTSLITCKCSHSQWNHFAASGLCTVGNCSCREFRRVPIEPDPDAARDAVIDRELGVA